MGGGIPGHMDDTQKIVISGKRTGRRIEDEKLVKAEGAGMFTEKLASIIGPSYTMAFFLGAGLGLTKVPPPRARRTKRLLINNYLNNIGKTSARCGNNMGGAIFMYLLVGKSLTFVFQEELEFVSENQKAALAGAFTGALYKCTRGVRPLIFASILGSLCGAAYSSIWQKGMLTLN